MRRASGGGRKPLLGNFAKHKVTRSRIALRAVELAKEFDIDLGGSARFVDSFFIAT